MQGYDMLKGKALKLINENLLEESVSVESSVQLKVLSPEEAIGKPDRQDYPLLKGKEFMIECRFKGARGQAFTDQPGNFKGTLKDVLALPLKNNYERAIFVSTLNALFRFLGKINRTVHCKNKEPKLCGETVAQWLTENFPTAKRIGIIGLQPSLLEGISKKFGPQNVLTTDMNPENIGTQKHDVTVLPETEVERLFSESDVVMATGSIFANGTFESVIKLFEAKKKPLIIYGVTGAFGAFTFNLKRYCPYGK